MTTNGAAECNVHTTPAEGKALISAYNLFFLHLSCLWNHLPYATEHIALVSGGTETQVQTLSCRYPGFAVKSRHTGTLTRSCSWSPSITKFLSLLGLHSFVGFGNTYEIWLPEEGKVKALRNLPGSGFWYMPSDSCHQYFYVNGCHMWGFTPRKSFSFTTWRHYQLPGHKHGPPGECNTFTYKLHLCVLWSGCH